jgi:excisionase family DNA binding protein
MTTSDTYNYEQAAEIMGVSARTLRRLVKAGKVPHRRFGALVKFTQADIDEILAMHRVAPLPRSSRQRR